MRLGSIMEKILLTLLRLEKDNVNIKLGIPLMQIVEEVEGSCRFEVLSKYVHSLRRLEHHGLVEACKCSARSKTRCRLTERGREEAERLLEKIRAIMGHT